MLEFHWRTVDEVDDRLYQAWTQLGMQTAHPNLYAMPQFVLPASRLLDPGNPARIAVIERRNAGGSELLGVGCFTHHRPTLFAPLPHLRCFRTRHTFQDGLLCAPGAAQEVADALLGHLDRGVRGPQAIAFRNVADDDPVLQALRGRADAAGQRWYPLRALQRPVLRYDAAPDARSRIPRRVAGDIERRQRRLAASGRLSFRLLLGADVTDEAIARHLDIEHMGWKGNSHSSMRSSATETAFFEDMCRRFRAIGSTVFCETLLDGRVIASASGFRVAATMNAFKTAHDPEFSGASPGKANILSLLAAIPAALPEVAMFDSSSREGSFIGAMLPDSRTMLAGFLPLTRLAARALKAARLLRPLAYRIDDDP